MTAPTLAEIAYRAWCAQQPLPQPLYKALTFEEKLGWAVGVQEALEAALTVPGLPPPPTVDLTQTITQLRQAVQRALQPHAYSLAQASRVVGVNRRTLTRWLAGEDNLTLRTLQRLETWVGNRCRKQDDGP